MADISDEQLQQLIDLGVIPDQQGMLGQQYAQATALRNSPMPEGRQYGRVYTAPSPFEVLGSMANKYAGFKQQKDIMAQQQGLLGQQTAGRRAYLDILRQQLLKNSVQNPPPTTPSGVGTTTNFEGQ